MTLYEHLQCTGSALLPDGRFWLSVRVDPFQLLIIWKIYGKFDNLLSLSYLSTYYSSNTLFDDSDLKITYNGNKNEDLHMSGAMYYVPWFE